VSVASDPWVSTFAWCCPGENTSSCRASVRLIAARSGTPFGAKKSIVSLYDSIMPRNE
jgi:hypothetical protein